MKNLLFIIILFLFVKINAQEIKFGKVSKAELEEKFYPLDTTADAVYLLKERKIKYIFDSTKGWRTETLVKERIKILNEKGYKYSEKEIKLYKNNNATETISSLKAYTFNLKNNKVERIKLNKKNIFNEHKNKYLDVKKFTIPNIGPNSIIDLTYIITSPFTSSISEINLQSDIPIKKLNVIVKIPEYFVAKKHIKGYLPTNLKESYEYTRIPYKYTKKVNQPGGFTNQKFEGVLKFNNHVYTINKKNVPKINEEEVFSSSIYNYTSAISFEISSIQFPNSPIKYVSTTWKDISKTIYNSSSFGKELRKTKYYKADLTPYINTAKNNFDKISFILQFVKNSVKWNQYYSKYTEKGVKKAYIERTGNSAEINLMLTSMLRFAGINANPVLVSTRNNGIPLFPTKQGFNYVISKVNLPDGTSILLDATEAYSTLNIIPKRALNWFGRELLENGDSKQVNLTPNSYAKTNNLLYFKINDLGQINGMVRKTFSGHTAMYFRQKNNLTKEETITSLEEEYNIEIEKHEVLNKENLSKPIIQNTKFTCEDMVENINNKLYFSPMLFLTTKENPFKSDERNFPIDYILPWQNKFSISITIPEGYIVESFPEDLAIGLPEDLGTFKYKINIIGNKIKLSTLTEINTSIISPEYYTVLKDFYTQLVKKQSEKIVLIKKTTSN